MAQEGLNEKLVFYIQQELDRGEDVVKLKDSLIKAGWEEDVVSTHLDSLLGQTSPQAAVDTQPPIIPADPDVNVSSQTPADEVASPQEDGLAVTETVPTEVFVGPGKPAIAAAIVLSLMLIGGIVYLIFF
ncbi:hypothetical protein KC571_01830 [candidate division WWE3 bacterium]|uniref:Uncharacterized protein n=1 Tax=candidate division WWE3 bacterium TaxID=2053526 RepID=A0A955RQ79_UNCKA|nr:hypothetical protein [candidate division WWE3 bacterium]